ncbi:MAG: hypothetical protein SVK08_01510 [Halobacteriota archaeon]|nr:hypothetical protein [Halobacteriota archaeon]
MVDHTKGPFRVKEIGDKYHIYAPHNGDDHGAYICMMNDRQGTAKGNARYLVECENACFGAENPEPGELLKLREMVRFLRALLPDWAKESYPGMDPTMYGTGSYEGDVDVINRVKGMVCFWRKSPKSHGLKTVYETGCGKTYEMLVHASVIPEECPHCGLMTGRTTEEK